MEKISFGLVGYGACGSHHARVIAEGPPAAVGSNREVIDAYLGRERGQGGER